MNGSASVKARAVMHLVFLVSALLAAVLGSFQLLKETRAVEPVPHRKLFQELPSSSR